MRAVWCTFALFHTLRHRAPPGLSLRARAPSRSLKPIRGLFICASLLPSSIAQALHTLRPAAHLLRVIAHAVTLPCIGPPHFLRSNLAPPPPPSPLMSFQSYSAPCTFGHLAPPCSAPPYIPPHARRVVHVRAVPHRAPETAAPCASRSNPLSLLRGTHPCPCICASRLAFLMLRFAPPQVLHIVQPLLQPCDARPYLFHTLRPALPLTSMNPHLPRPRVLQEVLDHHNTYHLRAATRSPPPTPARPNACLCRSPHLY